MRDVALAMEAESTTTQPARAVIETLISQMPSQNVGRSVPLFVGVEVKDNSQKPGAVSTKDDELNPVHFITGRRFAWTSFEEVGAKAEKRR